MSTQNLQTQIEAIDNMLEARAESITGEDIARLETELCVFEKVAIQAGIMTPELEEAIRTVYGEIISNSFIEWIEENRDEQ